MHALDSWLYRLFVCHVCMKFGTSGNTHLLHAFATCAAYERSRRESKISDDGTHIYIYIYIYIIYIYIYNII